MTRKNWIDVFNKTKIRNLINVKRFSGTGYLIREESVSDHCFDLFCICLTLVNYFNKNYDSKMDIKSLSYKILIHDLDESLYCDIPFDFKYRNASLTKEIKGAVNEMLLEHFDKELVRDIDNAKSFLTKDSALLYFCDSYQCFLKLHNEIHLLGNRAIEWKLQPCFDELCNKLNKIIKSEIFSDSELDELKKLLDDAREKLNQI